MTRTFTDLAKYIADKLLELTKEEGFETFNEMKKSYMWDTQDIKDEIYYIISHMNNSAVSMWDDCSVVEIGWEQMKWGQFKKLVFANIK